VCAWGGVWGGGGGGGGGGDHVKFSVIRTCGPSAAGGAGFKPSHWAVHSVTCPFKGTFGGDCDGRNF
jgi:hypothetical protein